MKKEFEFSDWSQTDEKISIVFQCEDLKSLSSSMIKLKMSKNGLRLYILENDRKILKYQIEEFYSEIVPKKTTSMRSGNQLTVVLLKEDPLEWPTLFPQEIQFRRKTPRKLRRSP